MDQPRAVAVPLRRHSSRDEHRADVRRRSQRHRQRRLHLRLGGLVHRGYVLPEPSFDASVSIQMRLFLVHQKLI